MTDRGTCTICMRPYLFCTCGRRFWFWFCGRRTTAATDPP